MILSVLLWNTGGIKELLEIMLQEAKYDILCIQEPWINTHTKGTYCPRAAKYHLVHTTGGRAAIYVSKRLSVSSWEYEATDQWCRISLKERREGEKGLEIWSVYNPCDSKTAPAAILQYTKPTQPTILAGDFNLHHPLWDGFGRCESKADSLLQLAME